MANDGDIQIRIESVDEGYQTNAPQTENGLASSDSTSVECEREEGSDVFNDEPSPVRSAVGRRKSIIKDPGRKSIGSNRKTVSFGSLPTELTVRSAKDCLKHMYSGGQLVKVRSASRVYRRFYWLDEEKRELKWEPSKKDSDKARVRRKSSLRRIFSTSKMDQPLLDRSFDDVPRITMVLVVQALAEFLKKQRVWNYTIQN